MKARRLVNLGERRDFVRYDPVQLDQPGFKPSINR
jgi:hypothetical protein